MTYKKYKLAIFIRVVILFLSLAALAFAIRFEHLYYIVIAAILSVYLLYNLYKYLTRRFTEIDDFFESVKYRDFSRWFNEKSGPEDLRQLYKGFNEVNKTIKEINNKKETQYIYLQKILEMIHTGIIAYHIKTGDILWSNDSFEKILGIPSLKNVSFIEKRKPTLYNDIFKTNHAGGNTITIDVDNDKLKVLVSSSVFQVHEDSFKLVVLQNIDTTLNKNESEAWKKLLSVMTHEIMNSIAPISSLADTLQTNIQLSIKDEEQHPLEIHDLKTGIESIRQRSEGLMKFAKTYRSLNKITSINLSTVLIKDLFENIQNLMQPSLHSKNIELNFNADTTNFEVEIDRYLIEQVLINLILNAVEACQASENPNVTLSVQKNVEGNTIIKVSDNGKGIPDEITDKIFVPFFTTKKNGSGIGLSLCKQIMLLHNGKIQIHSVEDKGTVISLVF
ncbi:HAMP domain-containing sensor histidine kinase [Aquimarina sp. 2201CG5-10]|uniref:sensor histidine kinase n=1 Tax=Aquimarina callyspongiae TaxID=3098150 RepID=UPI002AB5B0ED|nr:HAMP domain-containing sensor histidine kinase [Aquimarina sp. 2201CG5-10]MDY8137520.1 HAMP domain-containing sensor histidine kinase [Aquimarina sp. 2201CG5-10]